MFKTKGLEPLREQRRWRCSTSLSSSSVQPLQSLFSGHSLCPGQQVAAPSSAAQHPGSQNLTSSGWRMENCWHPVEIWSSQMEIREKRMVMVMGGGNPKAAVCSTVLCSLSPPAGHLPSPTSPRRTRPSTSASQRTVLAPTRPALVSPSVRGLIFQRPPQGSSLRPSAPAASSLPGTSRQQTPASRLLDTSCTSDDLGVSCDVWLVF